MKSHDFWLLFDDDIVEVRDAIACCLCCSCYSMGLIMQLWKTNEKKNISTLLWHLMFQYIHFSCYDSFAVLQYGHIINRALSKSAYPSPLKMWVLFLNYHNSLFLHFGFMCSLRFKCIFCRRWARKSCPPKVLQIKAYFNNVSLSPSLPSLVCK